MKKILIITIITSSIIHAGLFGNTPEQEAIAKKRLEKALSMKKSKEFKNIQKLNKENNQIKKILKTKNINYEYPMRIMKKRKNIKENLNKFWITEKEEERITKIENKELKRLLEANNIIYRKTDNIDKKEREEAKEKLLKNLKF